MHPPGHNPKFSTSLWEGLRFQALIDMCPYFISTFWRTWTDAKDSDLLTHLNFDHTNCRNSNRKPKPRALQRSISRILPWSYPWASAFVCAGLTCWPPCKSWKTTAWAVTKRRRYKWKIWRLGRGRWRCRLHIMANSFLCTLETNWLVEWFGGNGDVFYFFISFGLQNFDYSFLLVSHQS